MVHFTRWILIPAVLVGWLAAPQFAGAQAKVRRPRPTRTVQDDGQFFSEKAREKANEEIAVIKKKFDKDLLIETFAKAPENISKIDLKNSKEKEEFFRKWALDRARNADIRGVYVLICKDPPYVKTIEGDNERASGAFTAENGRELGKILVDKLKAKKNDEALSEAVAYFHKAFQDHTAKTTERASPASHSPVASSGAAGAARSTNWMGYICLAVVAILVIWMVVGLIRAFSGAGGGMAGGPMGGGYGYGGGGGGFMSGLMGGLFGAMAGNWI